MTAPVQFQKVAILDTNMLHFVGLYLEYAKTRTMFPWDGSEADNITKARTALDSLGKSHSARSSLQRGFHMVRIASENSLTLGYGTISELELLVGRARGQALLDAAAEGIPDRMWSGLKEKEIRDRVGDEMMRKVATGVASIGHRLDELELAESTVSRKGLPDAVELAREIVECVYMEAADSIVYASALLAGAEMMFTTDGPLRDTVNRVQKPGDAGSRAEVERFRRVREQLRRHTVTEPTGEPLFPRAHSVSASGRVKPEFT